MYGTIVLDIDLELYELTLQEVSRGITRHSL